MPRPTRSSSRSSRIQIAGYAPGLVATPPEGERARVEPARRPTRRACDLERTVEPDGHGGRRGQCARERGTVELDRPRALRWILEDPAELEHDRPVRQQRAPVGGDLAHKARNLVRAQVTLGPPVRQSIERLRLVVAPHIAWRPAVDRIPKIEQLAVQQPTEVRNVGALIASDDHCGALARFPRSRFVDREASSVRAVDGDDLRWSSECASRGHAVSHHERLEFLAISARAARTGRHLSRASSTCAGGRLPCLIRT